MNETEVLSKLYLELSNVVPNETITQRERLLIDAIKRALKHLDYATPNQRNGPVYQTADVLRRALKMTPMDVGGRPSDGLETNP